MTDAPTKLLKRVRPPDELIVSTYGCQVCGQWFQYAAHGDRCPCGEGSLTQASPTTEHHAAKALALSRGKLIPYALLRIADALFGMLSFVEKEKRAYERNRNDAKPTKD